MPVFDEGWTVDTLRVHLETSLAELDRRVAAALETQAESLAALAAAQATFLSKGEYLGQHATLAARLDALTAIAAGHIPRTESDLRFTTLAAELADLRTAKDLQAGRAGWSQHAIGVALAMAALATSVLTALVFVFRH